MHADTGTETCTKRKSPEYTHTPEMYRSCSVIDHEYMPFSYTNTALCSYTNNAASHKHNKAVLLCEFATIPYKQQASHVLYTVKHAGVCMLSNESS